MHEVVSSILTFSIFFVAMHCMHTNTFLCHGHTRVLNGVTVVTDVIGGVSGDLNQVCTCRKEGRERGHPPLID